MVARVAGEDERGGGLNEGASVLARALVAEEERGALREERAARSAAELSKLVRHVTV